MEGTPGLLVRCIEKLFRQRNPWKAKPSRFPKFIEMNYQGTIRREVQ